MAMHGGRRTDGARAMLAEAHAEITAADGIGGRHDIDKGTGITAEAKATHNAGCHEEEDGDQTDEGIKMPILGVLKIGGRGTRNQPEDQANP